MLEEKRKVGQEWVKIERKHVALQEKRELYVEIMKKRKIVVVKTKWYRFERQVKEKIEFLPEETVVKINVGGQASESEMFHDPFF